MSEPVLWARSGGMALTGKPNQSPLMVVGSPTSALDAALRRCATLRLTTVDHDDRLADLPGIGLLGERAAFLRRGRNAPWSVGGAFRILPLRDGWLGVSLSREADWDLIPALVEDADAPCTWETVATWAGRSSMADAGASTATLGLPAAVVPQHTLDASRPPVLITPGGSRERRRRPLVVDLSSLWAGPLCAHLLGLAGARVIKVESLGRPDGARRGSRPFFDVLHAGHECVAVDLVGDELVHELIAAADVVIEASRPRALAQLGIDAEHYVARGAIWVSVTAYGRHGDAGMRVGFGDDVAAGSGLVAWQGGVPQPAGDALADPLTGAVAAAAALEALTEPTGCLLDVSMHDVALSAASAGAPACRVDLVDGEWWVVADDVRERVAPPRRRPVAAAAHPLGADTIRIRREFNGAPRG